MIELSDVSVVIPAYNEEATIADVVRRLLQLCPELEIVVVSDGSTDHTASKARAAGARVVEHPYNLGNGASVRKGAMTATRPYLVLMDGDLQHRPEDVPTLLEHLPEFDMAVGSRVAGCDTSRVRNIGNAILIKIAESIGSFEIGDLTSGFRAVKREHFLRFAHLYPKRYSYPTTSTLAFLSSGLFVMFVPMPSIKRREAGQSNVSVLRDGMRFIHIIIRTVMMFNPQRVFLPAAAIAFVGGCALTTYQLLSGGAIRSSSIILLISSVMFFMNGLVVEMIAQMRRDWHE